MKFHWFAVLGIVCSVPTSAQEADEQVGDIFRITVFHESRSDGDTGSSSHGGGHEFIEKIVALRPGGVEKIYDVPREPNEESRLIDWQFPVRIFEAADGQMEIVNRGELEARRDLWLEAAKMRSDACGSWYFTWNAFQVKCDPDEVLETILAIKIQPERLEVGESFSHPAAMQPDELQLIGNEGWKFHASMSIDPDYFRRVEARSDVIVSEIMKEPITFEQAYARRSDELITGAIEVVLTASESGRVLKKVTTIQTTKIESDGETERTTSVETIERTKL